MRTPAAVLADLQRSDSARPRVTFYDDADGPTRGERVDLSARVLANWVAKAANLLQDELDVAPGTAVALGMPVHWRAVYWALAVWSVGATVVVPDGSARRADAPALADAHVLVTDDVSVAAHPGGRVVLVSLPMLARVNPATPAGAVDEARELATFGDVFTAVDDPDPGDEALRRGFGAGASHTAYRDLVVRQPDWADRPRVYVDGSLATVLVDTLSAFAADGSVVLVREPEGDQAARLATEGVTVDLSDRAGGRG